MVEEAKCEDVGKIRNNLFVEGCVGLLSWLCVCLARRFFAVKKNSEFPLFRWFWCYFFGRLVSVGNLVA